MIRFVIALIKIYQQVPFFPRSIPRCKYYPHCSEYTICAVEKYGVLIGLMKGLWRIIRCNPFSRGGLDLP